MALDAIPTYPSEYDPTGVTNNPPGSDSRKQGDDQFRVLKANMNQTWANVAGAVTASHEEINRLVGVSLVNPIITFPSGTRATVNQDTAPPEWTIDVVPDEMVMRLTKGLAAGGLEGGTTGGTNDFADQFQAHAEGAALGVGGHTLTSGESGTTPHGHTSPAHTHGILDRAAGGQAGNEIDYTAFSWSGGAVYVNDGGGGSTMIQSVSPTINNATASDASTAHSHTIDMASKYSTFIVIVKD